MERELKLKLPDRVAYDRLAEALGLEVRREHQVNCFLDTVNRDVQRSGKSVLRVREQEGQSIVTFKLGRSQREGYFQAEEIESEVSAELAALLRRGELPVEALELAPFRRLVEVFGAQERLVPQGSMRNLRRVFPLIEQDEVELDETTFPDGSVDFEVEVETSQPGKVLQALAVLGFGDLEPQEKTKYARFLERQ